MTAENTAQAPRKHTEVAVGVLLRESDGALLITSRPAGKPYAGFWEFPGGKLEAGETVEQALRRELIEELGVTIGTAHPWKVTEHDYPHALVRLHWCKVTEWSGEFEMRRSRHRREQRSCIGHCIWVGGHRQLWRAARYAKWSAYRGDAAQ